MKNNLKRIYEILLICVLALSFGYGACYIVNEGKIERNNYDVNNDKEVDILDLLELQKHLIEEREKKAQ